MKKRISMLLALAISMSLCACGSAETVDNTPATAVEETTQPILDQETEPTVIAEEYHETIVTALSQEEVTLTANRAVAYVSYSDSAEENVHDPLYSEQYIPQELLAASGEEICYIVRCTHGAKVVGQYTMAGAKVGVDAYQRWLKVEIEERKTGEILAETEILGSEPAEHVQSEDSHYGDYPDEAKVSEWIRSAIAAADEARQAKALEYASDRVSIYHYSRQSLINSMTAYSNSEFTVPEAEYAADNCGADWNENALAVTKEELENTEGSMIDSYRSYKGVIEYLMHYEDFTEEQAKYAADNCGADWKEQAVIVAAQYASWERDSMIFWMTEKLEKGGMEFTQEEAVYAADYYGLK